MPFGGRGKALPDDLLPELLKLRGQGKNAEELVIWLKETHNIEISAPAIRKRFAKIRLERAEITQAVIVDKLSRTVAKDLDEVGMAIERALEDELRARDDVDEVKEVTKIVDGKPQVMQVRLHEPGSDSWSRIRHDVSKNRNDLGMLLKLRLALSGADMGKKAGDTQQATDELLARVDKLMATVRQNVKPIPVADVPPTLQ